MERSSEGLHAVAWLQISTLRQRFDNRSHALPIEDAGDVMSRGGENFPLPCKWQFVKHRPGDLPAYGGESVAIEEQEWRFAVK